MSDDLHEIVPAAVLQLGPRSLALPLSAVARVATVVELTRIPLAPPALAGVAAFDGDPALLVDLRELLELPGNHDPGSVRAILCRTSVGLVGLFGARVRWVGRLRRAQEPLSGPLWRSGVEWRGGALPLVDLDLVLAALRAGGPSGEPLRGP